MKLRCLHLPISTTRFWTYDRWGTFYFGQVTQTVLCDESIVSQHVSRSFSLGFGFGRTGGDALSSLVHIHTSLITNGLTKHIVRKIWPETDGSQPCIPMKAWRLVDVMTFIRRLAPI
jgi:hypothetical protein